MNDTTPTRDNNGDAKPYADYGRRRSDGPLVSVVTPFYNTAEFLAECIESVLAQTYENFEYILLDNCSTDDSLEIARKYAKTDRRIRLIESTEFVGQIPNYNRAVAAIDAESVYTKVVEADNWLYADCLEKMVAISEENPTVVFASAYNVTEHAVRFADATKLRKTVCSGRDAARAHLMDPVYLFGSPTTVLYRSKAIRERTPFYPDDGIYAEDLRVCYSLLEDGDFAFVPQILTFVRTDNDSILSAIRNFDAMSLDRLIILNLHGRSFLNDEEFERTRSETESRYYTKLAQGLLAGRGRRFWKYHRQGQQSIGHRLRSGKLAAHVTLCIVSMIANPGRSLRALLRKLGNGNSAN